MSDPARISEQDAKAAVDVSHAEKAYARWAPIYDAVFTHIMRPGRKAIAEAANAHGGKTLNVGVGTGLELPMFTNAVQITGIDLSEPMLKIARKRVAGLGLTNVDELKAMDAHHLDFADASFDLVLAPYFITIVPDPQTCMDEMARVVRPGGEIMLVNHVATERGPIAWAEALLAKAGPGLGWDPRFPWSVIGDWIKTRPDIALLERRILPPLGLFSLVRLARK
jgi:phosphatidylethanolamine/phosphatidyl-N-methylethanolamine N-methyltransferase